VIEIWEHRKFILFGIRDILGYGDLHDDYAAKKDELLMDAVMWILEGHQEESFLQPGTATLGSRLRTLGKRFAITWLDGQRSRYEVVKARVAELDDHTAVPFVCEAFSNLELASIRADQGELSASA
jgi:hypothetical protein